MLFKESIPFAIIQNRGDGDLKNAITDMTWNSVVDLLSKHIVRASKNGAAIIPARFKSQEDWVLSEARTEVEPTYRNASNVEAITMAIIDIDKPGGLESAKELLKKYEYVVYSTHSYTAEQPYKFRLVLKLDKEIHHEQWPLAFKCLHSKIDLDKQCGDFSRLYYLPSVSPKADIKPVFIHNKGKAISYEEILQMGDPESLLEKKTIAKRDTLHFSGKSSVIGASLLSKIEWTWETLILRQKKYINDLTMDDSRHSFAMRVISSEVGKYGHNVNVDAVIQFLFKAAKQFSSKELNRGNTPSEIPEFFESALIKFSQHESAIAEYERINGVSLKESIQASISNAIYSQAVGRWSIDERVQLMHDSREMSERELRVLHQEDLRGVMQHGDPLRLFSDMLTTHIQKTTDFSPDVLAKFFIKSYEGFCSYSAKHGKNVSSLDDAVQQVTANFDFATVDGASEVARFVRASLKKSLIIHKNNMTEMEPGL